MVRRRNRIVTNCLSGWGSGLLLGLAAYLSAPASRRLIDALQVVDEPYRCRSPFGVTRSPSLAISAAYRRLSALPYCELSFGGRIISGPRSRSAIVGSPGPGRHCIGWMACLSNQETASLGIQYFLFSIFFHPGVEPVY